MSEHVWLIEIECKPQGSRGKRQAKWILVPDESGGRCRAWLTKPEAMIALDNQRSSWSRCRLRVAKYERCERG
jgi:hypothetical protein